MQGDLRRGGVQVPQQDLSHHPAAGRQAQLYHPDRHRQLQRAHQRAVHRPEPDDRRRGHRAGRYGILPEHDGGQPGGRLPPSAGRPVRHQAPAPGAHRRGDRQGPRGLYPHQGQLHDGAGGDGQAGGGLPGRGPGPADPAGHLLPAPRHRRPDGEHPCHQHRGPLSGARAHLLLREGAGGQAVDRLGGPYDPQPQPPGGDRLPRLRPGGPHPAAVDSPHPAGGQREGQLPAA